MYNENRLASPFYHFLHISQLKVCEKMDSRFSKYRSKAQFALIFIHLLLFINYIKNFLMIVNHISRVHSETKNLNPIVSILHRRFKIKKIDSRLNSSKIENNQLNIYHFGGIYCFFKFLKFKLFRNKSINVIFFMELIYIIIIKILIISIK